MTLQGWDLIRLSDCGGGSLPIDRTRAGDRPRPKKKTMSENIGTYPRYGTALCCSRPSFFPLFFFLFPYCRLFFPRGWLVRVSSVPVFPGSPGAGMGTGPSQYALLLIRCFFQKAWEREGERERMKWREGLTATERQNERRERNSKSRGGNRANEMERGTDGDRETE